MTVFIKSFSIFFFILFFGPGYAQIINNHSYLPTGTNGKTPEQIHHENLSSLQSFLELDVFSLHEDRGADFHKPGYVHYEDILASFNLAKNHDVVGHNKIDQYDPDDRGIGFCFGRAMFVHLDLLYRGVNRNAIKKAFVVGPMKGWGWHVTTIVQSLKDGKETWYAVDPIFQEPIEVSKWYEFLRQYYSTDQKLKLYFTRATRFGTKPIGYHENIINNEFYNSYFIDMMNWFEQNQSYYESLAPLRKF